MSQLPLGDKDWYNQFYAGQRDISLLVPSKIIQRYSELRHSRLFHLERLHQTAGDLRGKRVLFVACGTEDSGVLFALKGAEVWACDLAWEALRRQKDMALANGVANRTRVAACSCQQLPFQDGFFDLVVGLGILHHLQDDLDRPSREIRRVLKKDGIAIFTEPIIRSDLLQQIRRCIPVAPPQDASPQCHPLNKRALKQLSRNFIVEADFYKLCSRVDRLLLRDMPVEFVPYWKQFTVYLLHYLDYLLFCVPGINRLAGVVVLRLSTPSPMPGNAGNGSNGHSPEL